MAEEQQQLSSTAIQSVAALARAERLPKFTMAKPDAEPSDVYLVVDRETGQYNRFVAEQPAKSLIVYDIASLIDFLSQEGLKDGKILIAPTKVTAIAKAPAPGGERFVTAKLELPKQEPFADLLNIGGKQFKQRPFWNKLRTMYRDALNITQINVFKDVTWEGQQAASGSVGVQRESLGRSVTNSVRGLDALPEEMTFHVGVYAIPDVRQRKYQVLCAVDTDASTQTFALIPVANALELAEEEALRHIEGAIITAIQDASTEEKKRDWPVLYGEVASK